MKKSIMILGYIAVFFIVAGVIFKIMHWPGVNVLLILGCILLPFAYGIPLFIEKNKYVENSFQKFFNLWVLILMFSSVLFLFKFMYWPGGAMCFFILKILLTISIPIIIIHALKTKDVLKNINFHNEAILFIFITAVFFFTWESTVSKKVLTLFIPAGNTVLTELKYQEAKSNELFTALENAVKNNAAGQNYLEKANTVKTSCDSLNTFILSLENLMITRTGQTNGNPDSLQTINSKDNLSSPTEIMMDDKNGAVLKAKLNEFKALTDQNTNSRGKEILRLFFNTEDTEDTRYKNGCILTWESDKFECTHLVSVLLTLNQLRSDIRLLETETMTYLQAMAAQSISNESIHNKDKTAKKE